MDIGILEVWRRTFLLGKAMFPSPRLSSYRHRLALAFTVLLHFRRVRAWYEDGDEPLRHLARERHPLMDGAIYWPYLNARWNLHERLDAIDRHYRLLTGPAEILARAIAAEVELARFDDECPGLRLVLDRAPWLCFEGEVVLSLFLGSERYYALAFSLGVDRGEQVVLIGALQGAKASRARDVYREMTGALHGLRPRDLLVTALRLLAVQFGAARILAVGNEVRQCLSPRYGPERKNAIHSDLDRVWKEHQGALRDDGFFELPVRLRCKSMEEIPSRKRSAYKRRYRMLARTALALEAACGVAPAKAKSAAVSPSTAHSLLEPS